MTAWQPDWIVTVGNDVYTTVSSISYSTGRLDIDRQPTAGYCRIEIINSTGVDFTINLTEPITLQLMTELGYFTIWSGEVSDFNISVRSADESGFLTVGTILGIGNLSKLAKNVYNTALAEGLDGAQIAAILNEALIYSWNEITPTVTWAQYPPVQWQNAETYVGTVDAGFYTMNAIAASPTAKSQTLADQIATSALGQIYESSSTGRINYDDADHRTVYLAANGYSPINGTYAIPSSIKSTSGTNRMRNSLIYKYGTGYASTYSVSDSTSIATYGLFEKSQDSNIKNLADITTIGNRELSLRKDPRNQLEAITFRLDNPEMPIKLRTRLIGAFFGQPVEITNLPTNFFAGTFNGFVENVTLKATPTYVDLTLFVSATDLSIV